LPDRCDPDRLHQILIPGVRGFPPIDLRVVIVLAYHSLGHSVAPLEAESSTERPLSVRAAMMCIVTLSVLGWTAILLPLWAFAQ
jgi:hypothetical protein